ncbi:hypothetical protein JCM10449v2_007713 [Rhodotorula kratochvilovae]
MSLADFSFPQQLQLPQQRLRTVSAQLRNQAGLDDLQPALPALEHGQHAWGDWATTGYSPDRQQGAQQPYQDPYADLMSENAFEPHTPYPHRQAHGQHGLGFEVTMAMQGEGDEPAREPLAVAHPPQEHAAPLSAQPHLAALPPAQPAQSYPTSSPGRSRASSLHSSGAPTPLYMSVLTSPASPFFPQPLPSPFHDHRASVSSSTMNPSHSVRSSSPSDSASSVSGLNMSRIESGSATSSVYGGDSGSTAPSTPYRSGSISRQNSQRDSSQKHTRRRSSPIKTSGRHSRKLSNAERKAICQFHLTHPGWKQDDIGAHFGYERSTISKTLKFKEKYLAMDSEDEASASAVQSFLRPGQHQQQEADREPSEAPSPSATPVPSFTTPQPSPALVASSSVSSIVSLDSIASAEPFASSSGGGRFPQVDNALVAWAREHAAKGNTLADSVLQRQARAIARSYPGNEAFKASQTWLDGFKHRAGISGGAFLDERDVSPPARAPAPSTNSHRSLDPPREEDDEEDEGAAANGEQAFPVRRSKRSIGSKTVRRLASAKSTLAAFAEGFASRAASPAAASSSSRMDTDAIAGGSFGDLSMDSEATPTHSTVHSRAPTHATDRTPQLAQPFSYSPEGAADAVGTPSRISHHHAAASGSLMLGAVGGDYSPPDSAGGAHAQYGGYASGLTQPYSPHDLGASYSSAQGISASSSHSSLAGFAQQQGAGPSYGAASPVPSNQHRRSGSTASSTSVYSGLTAFSSQNGPGTPLTGSLYGSFRDSQGNLCASSASSVPGTPATAGVAAHTGFFGSEQAQLQNSFLSASGAGTTPSSQYSLASSQPASHASHPFQQQQHPSHHRYPPHHPQAYPQASFDSQQQQQQAALNRRATISGGLPFNGTGRHSLSLSTSAVSSAAMTPSSSFGAGPAAARAPVSLEQAFSSLEIALEYLSTRAGQDYVSPKDLVVLADLRGKMERARNAQGVSLAAISSAPATPSGLGPSSHALNSPFVPQQVNAAFAAAGPAKQQRMRLSRTQSTSSVPFFGGGAAAVAGMHSRRSGSSLSLYEVDGH